MNEVMTPVSSATVEVGRDSHFNTTKHMHFTYVNAYKQDGSVPIYPCYVDHDLHGVYERVPTGKKVYYIFKGFVTEVIRDYHGKVVAVKFVEKVKEE